MSRYRWLAGMLLCGSLLACTAREESALAGCARSHPPNATAHVIPVVYELQRSNFDNSGSMRHDYGDGMQATLVVNSFITSRNTRESLASDPRVQVILMPLVHARSCQRPIDLKLKGTGLGTFVNNIVEGKPSFDPDHRDQVPLETIRKELLLLSKQLGVDKPEVTLNGFSWKASQWDRPHNPSDRADAATPGEGDASENE